MAKVKCYEVRWETRVWIEAESAEDAVKIFLARLRLGKGLPCKEAVGVREITGA